MGNQVPLCLVCLPTRTVGRVSYSGGLGGSQTSPEMTAKPKLLLSSPLPAPPIVPRSTSPVRLV